MRVRFSLVAATLFAAPLLALGIAAPTNAHADAWKREYGPAKSWAKGGVREVTRTFGWSKTYGPPVYRCRRFSFECSYVRTPRYVRHWSVSYWQGPRQSRNEEQEPRSRAASPPPVTVSGNFRRISSPGRSARWVRVD